VDRDRARELPHLVADADELPQLHVRLTRFRCPPAPLGDQHDFCRHQREVVAGLVPVAAPAQVDLRHRLHAVLAGGVQQDRELDTVGDGNRQRLQQVPPGRPLAGQRLHDAGQLRPPQAEQRPGHQLGHPSAVGADRAVAAVEKPLVEPLDQRYPLVVKQRPEQSGDKVRSPVGQVGIDKDQQVALGDQQRLPQCLALAGERAQLRRDLARPVHRGPGLGGDLRGGVRRVRVHDDDLIHQAGTGGERCDGGDYPGDRAFFVPGRDHHAHPQAQTAFPFG
jgi:hypothetical protein